MKQVVWIAIFILAGMSGACDGTKKVAFYKLSIEIRPEGAGEVLSPMGPFERGRQIEVEAIPGEGYLFSGWSGDASGSTNPRTLTMDADKKLIAQFERKSYELDIAIEGEGRVREEIVTTARLSESYPHGTLVKLTAVPEEGWFLEKWEGDITGAGNPVEILVDNPKTVRAVFKKDNPVDLFLDGDKHDFFLGESYEIRMKVQYESGKIETVDNSELRVLEIGGVGRFEIEGNTLHAIKSGGTGVLALFRGFSKPVLMTILPIEEVRDFDPFLNTPAQGAVIEVPVVIINYLPTTDGVNLDMNLAPDDFYQLRYSTLEEAKTRIEGELKITKFGIEEGTRYRQFSTARRVDPYVGIKVVKYFNVYEMRMTSWQDNPGIKTPDYHDLFPKLGMEDLVNNQGVKEVWITMFNKDSFPSVEHSPYNDPSTYYGIPESNMSSPLTGDVSNSHQDLYDLPVYQKTYVVYGNSGHRGADTNLHNRGHQIERQLEYIENLQGLTGTGNKLFLNHFVGFIGRPDIGEIPNGRVGMTHFPPNAEEDYDYNNPRLVSSDIQNWNPEGGVFAPVNSNLWKSVSHDFNMINTFTMNGVPYRNDYTGDPHIKWLIYWWQAIPGNENDLAFGGSRLTN